MIDKQQNVNEGWTPEFMLKNRYTYILTYNEKNNDCTYIYDRRTLYKDRSLLGEPEWILRRL